MDYFYANSCPVRGEVARQLKYEDMPSKFVWSKDNKIWQLRKQNQEQIGRIVNIHPRSVETFHLRLLLKYVKGEIFIESIMVIKYTFNFSCFQEQRLSRICGRWMVRYMKHLKMLA